MKKKWTAILPYLVLAAALALAIGPLALWGSHNLDADQSSEMVLASLLNREGRLITDSWYYSTELRVISPVPLYQLGLLLSGGDWHAARVIGLSLSFLLCAAAMIYMARGAGLGESAVCAAAVVLLPVSEVHKFLFSLGGFYTMYIAAGCWLVGLVLRAGRGRGQIPQLVRIALLGVLCGLSGVRMPMICGAPLLIACLLEGFHLLRTSSSLGEVWQKEQTPMLLAGCLAVAAMLVGYLINSRVLAGMMHFEQFGDRTLGELDFAGFLTQLRYLAQYFGYKAGVQLLSLRGFVSVLVVLAVGFMAYSLVCGVARREALSPRLRVLLYTAAAALAMGMFINVVTGEGHNEYAVGYYLMGVFMLVLAGFAHLEKMPFGMPWLRRLCMLGLCGVLFLQAALFTRNHMSTQESEYEHAAKALTEAGYEAGFATFWHGNVLTEASDGALEIWTLDSLHGPQRGAWLQETAHMDTLPEGRVFVYVGESERYDNPPAAEAAHLIWESPVNGSCAYGYENAQEVMALLKEEN
ncbi:MAG: hypothetical protein J6M47_09210 [Clostridia bacterium]|nr:hypothetical protein [Clostridia bacterium]